MKDCLAILYHGFLWFFGGMLGAYTASSFILLLTKMI
jgi:hypothetical protein